MPTFVADYASISFVRAETNMKIDYRTPHGHMHCNHGLLTATGAVECIES